MQRGQASCTLLCFWNMSPAHRRPTNREPKGASRGHVEKVIHK